MKRRLLKYISLLMALIAVIASFAGCFDMDEFLIDIGYYTEKINANNTFEVLLRTEQGINCLDKESQKTVYAGEDAIFSLSLDDGYVYLGNSANAEYIEEGGKLVIKSVNAPITVDVYAAYKAELCYIEVYPTDNEVSFKLKEGSMWDQEAHTASLEAVLGAGYKVYCWSLDGKYLPDAREPNAIFLSEDNILKYTASSIGVHRIYLNVVPASEVITQDMKPWLNSGEDD